MQYVHRLKDASMDSFLELLYLLFPVDNILPRQYKTLKEWLKRDFGKGLIDIEFCSNCCRTIFARSIRDCKYCKESGCKYKSQYLSLVRMLQILLLDIEFCENFSWLENEFNSNNRSFDWFNNDVIRKFIQRNGITNIFVGFALDGLAL